MIRHGGRILVDQLRAQGVTRVFSVPGESFLAVPDPLYDSGIQNVVCRHEGSAAMMAEATGKMTGRPGVVFVTRGPGATNASSGVHVARQDSTPMILFVGQIARGHRDREAFQEVDYRTFFGPIAKWAAEIDACLGPRHEKLNASSLQRRQGRPQRRIAFVERDVETARAHLQSEPARSMPARLSIVSWWRSGRSRTQNLKLDGSLQPLASAPHCERLPATPLPDAGPSPGPF